jgi:hypothetical protein
MERRQVATIKKKINETAMGAMVMMMNNDHFAFIFEAVLRSIGHLIISMPLFEVLFVFI